MTNHEEGSLGARHIIDEAIAATENYFGAISPKRNGHIWAYAKQIDVLVRNALSASEAARREAEERAASAIKKWADCNAQRYDAVAMMEKAERKLAAADRAWEIAQESSMRNLGARLEVEVDRDALRAALEELVAAQMFVDDAPQYMEALQNARDALSPAGQGRRRAMSKRVLTFAHEPPRPPKEKP